MRLRRGSGFLAGAAVVLCGPAFSKPPPSPLSGVFSSVELGAETGDLGGLEIELHPEEARPYALVVFCEGWCNRAHRVPVELSGTHFRLSFTEPVYDSAGLPAGTRVYQINGQLAGRHLITDLGQDSYRKRFRLERREARLGLAVADLVEDK